MMNRKESIRLAFSAVRANLLRAILTLMIIAFGIMALVGILTAIDSAIFALSDNFSKLGANSFTISPKNENVRGNRHGRTAKESEPISFDEAMEFSERFEYKGNVSVSMFCTRNAEVTHDEEKTNPNVMLDGVDESFLALNAYELEEGRNFTNNEATNGAYLAIIGNDIVDQLFAGKSDKAMNKSISIGNGKYKVVGVLKSKGSSMNQNDDRRVLIPLQTGKRFYGTTQTSYKITVGVNNSTDIDDAAAYATGLMRNVRRLKAAEENDFEIFKSDGLIASIKENTVKIRMGAIAIALITLIGAAIGLMNIMLVSVTERTREIGIIKALGATKQNVLTQFLVEAIIISLMGGVVGIILGVLMGFGVSALMGGSFHMPWLWITVAFLTCTIVGLFSGLYPAIKAASQDPIEALRHE
ncbi:MAG: ABC transporter permease [Saprospiraceae bacterium]